MKKTVWLFESGEMCEGGSVEGVYATKDLAMEAMVKERERLLEYWSDWVSKSQLRNPWKVSKLADDDSDPESNIGFTCGCDWYLISEHTIVDGM